MSLEETTVAATDSAADASVDSAPSTDTDYRSMSADEILDLPEDFNADEPAAQDETDTKDVSEAKPVAESKTDEEKPEKSAKDEDLEDYEPESIKSLYARPELKTKLDAIFKAHPEVRSAWFRSAQIADLFPTVAEARELRTMFPTVEGAKLASNAAAVLADMDRTYIEDPKTFVSNLSRGNPDAFAKMLETSREVLYELNPQAYTQLLGNPVALDLMANANQVAQETGDEALQAALAIVADRFKFPGTGPKQPAGPEDPRIRQFEDLKQQAAEARTQTFAEYSSRTDQDYWDGLHEDVAKAIGKPEAMSQKALERITKEVIDDVTREIAKRPDLKPQYEQFKRRGDLRDPEFRARVSGFLRNYAKAYVGKAVRTRMGEWTNEILAANKREVEKVEAKPKHKDVGSGSGQAGAPKRGNGKVDYRKVTDQQILDGDF